MAFTYPGYRTNFRANNFGLQLVPHNNAMEDWKLLLTAEGMAEVEGQGGGIRPHTQILAE